MVDRFEAATRLAQVHYEIEPGISRIFTVKDAGETEALPNTPIKLLEVNADTCSSGVMPLYFGAAPEAGIPYPSVIIEITPGEFEQLRTATLKLPNGWTIGDELPKPSINGAKR